jgi:hypothetical protein
MRPPAAVPEIALVKDKFVMRAADVPGDLPRVRARRAADGKPIENVLM